MFRQLVERIRNEHNLVIILEHGSGGCRLDKIPKEKPGVTVPACLDYSHCFSLSLALFSSFFRNIMNMQLKLKNRRCYNLELKWSLQDFIHVINHSSLLYVCVWLLCENSDVCVFVRIGQGDKSLRANLNQRQCTLGVDVCRHAVVVITCWLAELFITAPQPPTASQLFPSQYISAHDGERPPSVRKMNCGLLLLCHKTKGMTPE